MKFLLLIFLISCFCASAQKLDWSRSIEGINYNKCNDIEVDNEKNIYITGEISDSVNFNLLGGFNIQNSKQRRSSNRFAWRRCLHN